MVLGVGVEATKAYGLNVVTVPVCICQPSKMEPGIGLEPMRDIIPPAYKTGVVATEPTRQMGAEGRVERRGFGYEPKWVTTLPLQLHKNGAQSVI